MKLINRVSRPLMIFRLRERWMLRRDKRPVFLVDRAFFHPATQQRNLVRLQGAVRFRRRHSFFGVVRLNPPHQRTLVRISSDDRRTELFVGREGEFPTVQAQSRLARARVGSVAGIAVLRKNRLDSLVERQPSGTGYGCHMVSHAPNNDNC